MRTLVIDTATPWLSIALFDGDALVAHAHREIGRGHAEQLVPTIAALPEGGRAERIWVGCGPGSFTGVRIGIAAARALAFAWGAALRGFDTLALVAASARQHAELAGVPFTVVIDGGHGEWLIGGVAGEAQALPPQQAAAFVADACVAGARAQNLVTLRGWGTAFPSEADARAAMSMNQAVLLPATTPIYARAPDAHAPDTRPAA